MENESKTTSTWAPGASNRCTWKMKVKCERILVVIVRSLNNITLILFIQSESLKLKPMFHCDAKPFALGTGIGLDTQCHNFALPIPTCWYLKTRKHLTPNLKFASVEYRLRLVPNTKFSRWPCTFHAFCVDFICVWSPTQT